MAKHKGGRPSKLAKIDLGEVERLAGLGLTDEEMAIVLDVSPRAFAGYKKNSEFLQALKRGKPKKDTEVVQRLLLKAMEGDVTAMIFWLKNRQPDKWRDRRDIGLGGNGAGSVDVKIEVVKVREGKDGAAD